VFSKRNIKNSVLDVHETYPAIQGQENNMNKYAVAEFRKATNQGIGITFGLQF